MEKLTTLTGVGVPLRRSNVDTDISALCAVFGGGGHQKAAGCTIRADKKTALEKFAKEAKNYLV